MPLEQNKKRIETRYDRLRETFFLKIIIVKMCHLSTVLLSPIWFVVQAITKMVKYQNKELNNLKNKRTKKNNTSTWRKIFSKILEILMENLCLTLATLSLSTDWILRFVHRGFYNLNERQECLSIKINCQFPWNLF